MDGEILETLLEIRNALYVLIGFVCVVYFIRLAHWLRHRKNHQDQTINHNFIATADRLFASGDFDSLITHCSSKLSQSPNHSYATWWLARAKLELGMKDEAKQLFVKALELRPSWKETHIDIYLSKLNDE